jgi:ATP-dependent helicase/nuclease subunit B
VAAVTIIAGRAGSGKTLRCFSRIVDAIRKDPLGPPIYWIVPRQSTFALERWLTCGSGLEAVTRCRVVSFEGLADEVLAAHPGVSRVVVSALGRLAVMGHLLRAHAATLKHFRLAVHRPGLAREVLGVLDELSRNGSMVRDDEGRDCLDRAADALPDEVELAEKVHDLRLLRDAYRQFMGDSRFDKDARLEHVLRHTGATPAFRGATFYVDGFLDFLDFERRMLISLCQTAQDTGGSVDISFSLPPETGGLDRLEHVIDSSGVFHRIEAAHLSIRQLLRERQIPVNVEKLTSPVRTVRPELLALEQAFSDGLGNRGRPDAARLAMSSPPAVEFIVAPDHRTELNAVARRIRELTCDPDGPRYRCRDIVVLARSLSTYSQDLGKCLTEHGIPHYLDRRHDATAHPLPRLVRAAVALATDGWKTAPVVALCRSGLVRGCDLERACQLDHWAVSRGIDGQVWTLPHPQAPAELELLRSNLVAVLTPWLELMNPGDGVAGGEPPGAKAAISGLLKLLEDLGVREELSRRVIAHRSERGEDAFCEDLRVWEEFTAFLEELDDLLGSVAVPAADLHAILAAAFESLDLGSVPESVDQVIVGEAERTRIVHARAVFVLGLSQGEFPASHSDAPLMTDRQRARLLKAGVMLEEGADRRQLDERLIAYLAMTRASERVVLSRPANDPRGQAMVPSPYWIRAESLFESPAIREVAGASRPEEVSTPEQLVRCVLREARTGRITASPLTSALYEHVRLAASDSVIGELREWVWGSLQPPVYRLQLPADVSRALRPLPMPLSVGELERYIRCPFQGFMRDVLKPEEVSTPGVDGRRLSGVLNRSFLQFTLGLLSQAETANWDQLDLEQTSRRLSDLTRRVIADEVKRLSFDGSSDPARLSPRDRQLLRTVEASLLEFAEAHREAAGRTRFLPEKAGARFAEGEALQPLSLRDPQTGDEIARVSGRIDRIDRTQDGKLAAWDYRLGEPKGSVARLYHLIDLEPIVQLLVLEQSGKVAGALALPLRSAPESFSSIRKWQQAPLVDSPEYRLTRRRGRGIFREDAAADFDTGVAGSTEASKLITFRAKKESGFDRKQSSDCLDPATFDLLLQSARRRLEQVAAAMAQGDIRITPFQFSTTSACVHCDYRSACRFNPREGGSYVQLTPTKSSAVVARLQLDLTQPKPLSSESGKESPEQP